MPATRTHVLAAAAREFLRLLWRIARQLFHEATGVLFLLFAVVGGFSAWRAWQQGSATWLTALSIGFTLMMAAFAVASFRAARRAR